MKKFITALLALSIIVPSAKAATGLEALAIPQDSLTFEWDFVTTAYYSPLADQSYYLLGDFDAEKRLNGNGTNGADGTPVEFGLIAAPANMPFGTKIYIPGIGLGEVHDRGGAIKNSRIDIWMGKGESGLQRALSWGKQEKHCTVYLPGATVPEAILSKKFENSYLFKEVNLPANQITALKNNSISFHSLKKGDFGQEVTDLQTMLQKLGYLTGFTPNGVFGDQTEKALISLQVKEKIITSADSSGAGYYGPKTAAKMQELARLNDNKQVLLASASDINTTETVSKQSDLGTGGPVLDFNETLTLGMQSENVKELQTVLNTLGFYQGEFTGYYGLRTSEAVFKFQLAYNILGNKDSTGAGIFGPKTRKALQDVPLDQEDIAQAASDKLTLVYDMIVLGEAVAEEAKE
ncbi:MAG: peptidoglycan-binding protein [Patescibacteria group bacterium]|nr:peptidoglycan-binding protein [Patescibacteria group bacterium]